VAVLAIGVLSGIGFGAVGVLLALRAKSASTVQGIFPLVFVVLFVSSAFFPADLLSSPSDLVATYNPLSYVAEGLREPIAFGDDAGPVLAGLAAAAGIAVVFVALAVAALHGRLREP
jgi:ABC-2 type transport system permease protein